VPPFASVFVFRSISSETLRVTFRKLSASKIFTQFSRVRHLVVTVCCFGLKHDSQRHLHIQSREKPDNDQFLDFRRALRERLRDTESGAHLT
jgi:hypothetical protein